MTIEKLALAPILRASIVTSALNQNQTMTDEAVPGLFLAPQSPALTNIQKYKLTNCAGKAHALDSKFKTG